MITLFSKGLRAGIAGLIVVLIFNLGSCSTEPQSLKEAFADDFLVGSAINMWTYSGRDSASIALVKREFNTVTAENSMKWERIHPNPDEFNFGPADMFVEFGEENGMNIVGHVLIWHSQTPRWVFRDENGDTISREALLERMKNHIETIMTHYKGKVDTWDVVNEALEDDGTLRKNNWYNVIGEDWVEKAFEFAQGIDPDAKLIYNDFSLSNPEKRDGAIRLVKSLQEKGLRVDGIGMQCHYHMDYPSLEDLEASIVAFGELGVGVHVTELDINVLPAPWDYIGANVEMTAEIRAELNPYPDSLPAIKQKELAERYADFFRIFKKHSDVVERVTFWAVSDRSSWLNNWPVRGRTNYPMLFDRQLMPKPAYYSVMEIGSE